MPYTLNPYLPRVRMQAVLAVRRGWSARMTARHFGVAHSTVLRWIQRAPRDGRESIPTASSRPHTHPRAVAPAIVERIREIRLKRGRCAEVIHAQLVQERVSVSLSTVKRTLAREGLLRKRSPWKHWHQSGERPWAERPGVLVEIDSIHLLDTQRIRTYIVALLDVCSRWAYAWALPKLTSPAAVAVVGRARRDASFPFTCLQSDHGSEFSSHFTRRLLLWNIRHRHIRVRKPNDNAHIERFNRTLQDECRADLIRYQGNPKKLNRALMAYLAYYNTERPHLGLGCKTPDQVVRRS